MSTFQSESYTNTNINVGYHSIIKNDLSSDDKETKHKQEYSNIYQNQQLLDKYVQTKKVFDYMSEFTPERS